MLDKNNILILCKVVDNFGDIGVAYRLARALSDIRPALNLTLVVSNLETFHKLAPEIDAKKPIQPFHYKNSVWTVIDWNTKTENGKRKTENDVQLSIFTFQFSIILECFQCGRPDWLENLLFSDDFTDEVQILQIDYLTAEDYADEFHLLKSGTRKTNIKKRFFMPGFTEKTGGLIINGKTGATASPSGVTPFAHAHSYASFSRFGTSALHTLAQADDFSIFFFAYEFDCASLIAGISDFQANMRKIDANFSVCVFVADGKSSAPFEAAWKKANSPFKIEKIPFLPQEEFDSLLLQMDFLFVRGEDSLARACLSGIPFVWQAYIQDENYQLVKVNALLERMKSHFDEENFFALSSLWQKYNNPQNPPNAEDFSRVLTLSANGKITRGFEIFAESLGKNGNLAEHLLSYIDSLES